MSLLLNAIPFIERLGFAAFVCIEGASVQDILKIALKHNAEAIHADYACFSEYFPECGELHWGAALLLTARAQLNRATDEDAAIKDEILKACSTFEQLACVVWGREHPKALRLSNEENIFSSFLKR